MNKIYYNSILSVTFSPCGSYLVTGNIYGDIVLFNLNCLLHNTESALTDEIANISKKKINFNSCKKHQVCSLVSNEQFLIAGGIGEICGWSWNDIINSENGSTPTVSWKICIPSSDNHNADTINEVNSIKVRSNDSHSISNTLYAGCGDNNIYAFSLEDGQCLRKYLGHTDFVHSVDIRDNTLISGSEDGFVKIWDTRVAEATNALVPHRNNEISRPDLGHWVGAVSLNEDWLLCGGGNRLSLWNLRTLDDPMTVFSNTQDNGIHVAQFHQDLILTGGSSPVFSLLSYNDELHSRIQSSNTTVYSCAVGALKNSQKVLCLTGNSNNIDVSTNFNYREYVVPFY